MKTEHRFVPRLFYEKEEGEKKPAVSKRLVGRCTYPPTDCQGSTAWTSFAQFVRNITRTNKGLIACHKKIANSLVELS